MKMWRKRTIFAAVIFLVGISVLLGRLAQIQLIDTKSFSGRNINLIRESVKQRSQEFIIDHGRGAFYDRNMEPVTHSTIPSLILFPFLKNTDWDVEKVTEITGIPERKLLKAVDEAEEPFVFGGPRPLKLTPEQMDAINNLKIPGVFAVEIKMDKKDFPAAQLIGTVGQNDREARNRYPDRGLSAGTKIGILGLQKSFDEFLLQEEQTKLVYHVDGKGGPLFGAKVKYVDPSNPFYPLKVQTTIDLEIQNKAEEIVDQFKIEKGGLILLDISSNSILANVSRPKIDLDDPFQNEGAKNFMFTAQIPGSVFKTVIAAAAIEYRLISPRRIFDCNKTIHGTYDEYRHGRLDFTKSFAVSCNNTFATLATELIALDPRIIETYAEKLGLTEETGWRGQVFHFKDFKQFSGEEKGHVYLNDEERHDRKFAAQTGIGQQSVRITPVAAANMMATIARGGEKKMVRAVSDIRYKNGNTLFHFPEKSLGKDGISPYTAGKLQKLLREVVVYEEGTGHALNELPYTVAGKSGTAETHRYAEDGKEYLNKWFVGYFPYENPKYALAVVNLDVFSDEGSVIPVFQEMVEFLYEYDKSDS